MENTWFIIPSIAASGSARSEGTIPLVRARTLSVTVRLYFGSSIDADTTIDFYYSPDGNNWDTEAYTSFDIAYDTEDTEQRTCIIDVPEHGYMMLKITNGSDKDTIDNIRVWFSIQAWQPGKPSKGDISTRTMKD